MKAPGRHHGFTLVEVVVAMMILAFLSLFTVQSIQSALKTRTKVQKDIDKNSTLRDALRIMERDINMAFNYRDPNIRLHNMAVDEQANLGNNNAQNQNANQNQNQQQQQQQQQQQAQQQNPTAVPPRKKKVEKIWTQFIGETESLSFTSLSNVRLSEDSAISSQAEIGYRIKPCRRRSTQEQSSKCLWRRISNYIHEDITKEGQETVLLENVVEFKLRYLGPGRDDEWTDAWITNERGDDVSKNKFPYAVEITIAIKDTSAGSSDKNLRMTTVASLRNPNNIKEEPKKDANPAPGGI